MLTKEYAKGLSEEQIKEYVDKLFITTEADRDYLQKHQLEIKRYPEAHEDVIEKIRANISATKGDIAILKLIKLATKPLTTYSKIETIESMITNITGIINVCFYKYESKKSPIKKFKDEIIAHTNGEGQLYTDLMLLYQFYVTLEESQKKTSELCKRARKNSEYDDWYREMSDYRNVTAKIVTMIESTGRAIVDNEALSHTIFEVLFYEYNVICCKLDRYIVPFKLRNLS